MNSVKIEVTNIVLFEALDQIKNHAWYDVTNKVLVEAKMRLDHTKVTMMVDFEL
jgi:hypothetical protein